MSFIDDVLGVGVGVVVADRLLAGYCARLDAEVAQSRKLAGLPAAAADAGGDVPAGLLPEIANTTPDQA